jgi:ubiquinone/menaquinone biosynthesis C-methylase UbiE
MQRDELKSYYEAGANEYDQAYVGRGSAAIGGLADRYVRDVDQISRLLSGFGHGHLVDIACGTGFWLPFYAPNCRRITLLDQSTAALSKSRERVDGLGLHSRVEYLEGDVLDMPLPSSAYDCAVIGFLLSHFTEEHQATFFLRLKSVLKADAPLAVCDSLWSDVRQPYRKKESYESRTLSDGRSFNVYKKYFEASEFESMLRTQGFKVKDLYVGDLFIAATAEPALGR